MDRKMLEKLKKFNKNFATQKSRADELGGFSEVPDGKYLSKVSECSLKESNAGQLHFVFQFEILESAEDESIVGTKVSKWAGIESEDGMAYLIRDLRRFGLEAESAEDLGKIADLLNKQKPEVKITLKSKDSGQFCYIDKVISEIDPGDLGTAEDSDDGSDDAPAEDDGSDDAGDDEDVALEVGMEVSFAWKGEEMTGRIKEINEKEEKLKVSSGGKVYPVKLADVTLPEAEEAEVEEEVEEEEVEEEEEKPTAKKVAAKKVAPKAKAKPAVKKRR